jgi:broad specificity phosphatase PhoE
MLIARFIRHGESLANAGGITAEPASIPLTSRGHEQAQTFARALKHALGLIITSPYIRARDTAAPVADRFPDTPLEVWPVQEFSSLSPDRRMYTTAEQRRPWVEAFFDRADPHFRDGPHSETFAELIERVRTTLDRLTSLPALTAYVFSHGQFMKAMQMDIEHCFPTVTPEVMSAFWAEHCSHPIQNLGGFTAIWDGMSWSVALQDKASVINTA